MASENKKEKVCYPALVLSGGGARAAYQVGVICALGEILPQEKIPFPVLCGTSAGSVNIAFLAAFAKNWDKAASGIADVWRTLQLNDVYETSGLAISGIAANWISRTALGGLIGSAETSNYLLDTKPLDKLLRKNLSFPAIRANIEEGILSAVSFSAAEYFAATTVTFFESGSKVEAWAHSGRRSEETHLERRHVLASAAIPIFFPPVKIENSYFGDGCLRQTSPLSPAIHLGASRILSVGIRPHTRDTNIVNRKVHSPTVADISGEIFNALFLDSMETDIERAQRINEALEAASAHKGFSFSRALRPVPILHLAPTRNLTEVIPDVLKKFPPLLSYCLKGLGVSTHEHQGKELLSYLAFLPECIGPLIELGYNDTLPRKGEIQEFMAA
ncbi:MAG: patatin-like phospholipase family protein [Bdellovibrionota bacterium]